MNDGTTQCIGSERANGASPSPTQTHLDTKAASLLCGSSGFLTVVFAIDDRAEFIQSPTVDFLYRALAGTRYIPGARLVAISEGHLIATAADTEEWRS